MEVSLLSKIYIETDMEVDVDLTGATVEWSFPTTDQPPSVWIPGEVKPGTDKTVRLLFDPTTLGMTRGQFYDKHLRVSIAPQVFEDQVGVVLIT